MNLTENPEIVHWPETHYAFVEKHGLFPEIAPQAWQKAHSLAPLLKEDNRITGTMSLYRMGPNVYRAGFALAAPAVDLPSGLSYEKLEGGKYSRFVLTGPYSNLPEASGRAWKIVSENKVPLRDDFNIENYVNDPNTTPEDQLITEILFPMA
jgi:predicted transcriptional regulator YdeE